MTRSRIVLVSLAIFVLSSSTNHAVYYLALLATTIVFLTITGITIHLFIIAQTLNGSHSTFNSQRTTSITAESRRLVRPFIFTSSAAWSVLKTRAAWETATPPLLPTRTFPSAPPPLDDAITSLLDAVISTFVLKWYSAISSSPSFPNAIDRTLRETLVQIVQRVERVDWSDVIVGRILPLVTEHVEAFRVAEYAGIGSEFKSHASTDSNELDLSFAKRYAAETRSGKLHPAVPMTSVESKGMEEQWLRELLDKLLPIVMPAREIESTAVRIVARELVACAVIVPLVDLFSDPDFWNRLIEQKAGAAIRDQRMVTQFREALDKEESSSSLNRTTSKPSRTDEISVATSTKHFEIFVKRIGKRSLADARRLRNDVNGQIRKTKILVGDHKKEEVVGGFKVEQLSEHIERLYAAKRKIDQRILDLGGHDFSDQQHSILIDTPLPLKRIKLRDILLLPAASAYFSEYEQRRHRSPLRVQFWLLIESLKDPLEDVDSSSDDDTSGLPPHRPDPAAVTKAMTDLKMIWNVYFATSNELESNRKYVRTIKEFVETAETDQITTRKLRRVRRAVFAAQQDVLEEMEEEDYPGFVQSELYFKAVSSLASVPSTEVSSPYLPFDVRQHRPPSIIVDTSPPVSSASQFAYSISRSASPRIVSIPPVLPAIISSSTLKRIDRPIHARVLSDPVLTTISPTISRAASIVSADGLGIILPSLPTATTSTSVSQSHRRRHVPTSLSNSLEFLMASPNAGGGVEKKERRTPLFSEPLFAEEEDDNEDSDEDMTAKGAKQRGVRVMISDDEYVQVQTIEAIQEALNSILATDAKIASTSSTPHPDRALTPDLTSKSFHRSLPPTRTTSLDRLSPFNTSSSSSDSKSHHNRSRPAMFPVDDIEESEMIDAPVDPTFIRLASPGDLQLLAEIARLAGMIDKLTHQEAVVGALIRKAELTNVASELKLLMKSRESLRRELRTLKFQKASYESQEDENRLVVGRTQVEISGTTIGESNFQQSFQLYLVEVHQLASDGSYTSGWIVTRRYSEFIVLQTKLKEKYGATMRGIELPGKRIVERVNEAFIEQRKRGLEKYLKALIQIPTLCESIELRSFLSQQNISLPQLDSSTTLMSSSFLGQGLVRSFYRTFTSGIDDLLSGSNTSSMMDTIIQRLSQQVDDISNTIGIGGGGGGVVQEDDFAATTKSNPTRNGGAKEGLTYFTAPICDLFITVFELKEKNNWLRRQAILIILQQVLGGTIERKFRDTLHLTLSPPSLTHYITLLQSILVPSPTPALSPSTPLDPPTPPPPRTPLERALTRDSANEKLLTLFPAMAANLIGRSNAKLGANRLFNVVQNRRLNRHLIYCVMREVIESVWSEVKEEGTMGGAASR